MNDLILVVEDQPDLAALLKDYLENASFRVHIIADGCAVITWVKEFSPSVIILDLMLPGKDGLQVCREIRSFSQAPIMITTAKVDELHRIVGLEAGADDYLCKPYSPREAVARVKALLRRGAISEISTQLIQVDSDALSVCVAGINSHLTVVEYHLFKLLFDSPRRIFSRREIMSSIYNDYRIVSDRTIDSHIKKLRKKIHRHLPGYEVIHSVYGAGYKYQNDH
jgi:two-component system response regulator BaeR